VGGRRKQKGGTTPKSFALFWVTTDDGSEDCFVVAQSAKGAARFLERDEGYDAGSADAEHVADLPDGLQNGVGWRDGSTSDFSAEPWYAPDTLVVACGGEIAEQRTDDLRGVTGDLAKDFRFGGRRFRSGDVVTGAKRALGISEPARLAAFEGGRPLAFPPWWQWELELTPHLEKRMEDRSFTEVDLRSMLETASGYRVDVVEDRFVIETRFKGRHWEVIVEPDEIDHLLVVVTAYGVDR
jgi:hypothetical protein